MRNRCLSALLSPLYRNYSFSSHQSTSASPPAAPSRAVVAGEHAVSRAGRLTELMQQYERVVRSYLATKSRSNATADSTSFCLAPLQLSAERTMLVSAACRALCAAQGALPVAAGRAALVPAAAPALYAALSRLSGRLDPCMMHFSSSSVSSDMLQCCACCLACCFSE